MASKLFGLPTKLKSTLRPKVFMMILAESKNNIVSRSSIIDEVLAKHYLSLPEAHQRELIAEFERLLKIGAFKKTDE